ncbi:fibro-slime domain-containing protein [Fibrobacter sp.]|uniref:fibro-slime domain-containing protein n=1 Tax=Fibrobacter sp. TaxID=35828 RepID=UPI0025BE0069|nr:fibro-slime domain-containing protein [Fibrobacter sp.]
MNSIKAAIAVSIAICTSTSWANLKNSQTGNDVCSPKIHFKLPKGWSNAYLVLGETAVAFPKAKLADNGWTMIDLGSTKTNDDSYFYINAVDKNNCNDGMCVTRNGVNVRSNNARIEGFTCKDVGAGGEIWIQEHPDSQKEGLVYVTKSEPNVKDFYVFLPSNKTWSSSTPMINEDGKSRALEIDPAHCGWFFRRYIDEKLPTSVVIYRDDDVEMNAAIGMGGERALNEDLAAEPISLNGLFELFQQDPSYADAVYFVADHEQADMLPSDNYGWFATRPSGAVGNCSYSLATEIYDTDAQLHPSFSCWSESGEGCQAASGTAAQGVDKETALNAIKECMGVTTGIVESTLDAKTKKPKLTTAGKKCFIDEKYFNQLFSYTEGVNETSCFDMPFYRSKDGKWEFDSDYFVSPGVKTPVQGGFYPAEATTDAIIKAADQNQTPAPLARTKHNAEGPVFWGPELRKFDKTENVPTIDLFCNGPGWSKGFDCEGLFADGEETETYVKANLKLNAQACVFGWSCDVKSSAPEEWPFYAMQSETSGEETQRWISNVNDTKGNKGRNLHFCSASHSNFRYKKGLKFNFRGSDDLWVFIDNKLAVDLGGTHLPAPGYVDVDQFFKKNGLTPDVGKSIDIDIFSCNRRSMSNSLRIKTNMFIEQTSGITAEGKQNVEDYMKTGNNHYKFCYKKSGNGPCTTEIRCGEEITEKISYILSRDKTGQDPAKALVSEADFTTNPKQFCNGGICGIDVSNPTSPIINDEQLRNYISAGKYYLIVKIGGDSKAIEINIKGTISIANREAFIVDENGNRGPKLSFKSQAMASIPKEDGSPDIAQMIPLYIASIIDPCVTTNCTEPLEIQSTPSAANTPYTLQVSNKKALFYKMKDNKLVSFKPDAGTTIGESGVDTIYVTIPFDDMEANEERISINVSGSSRKAEITFFVPRLAFVDSRSTYNVLSGDKDSDKPRIKGGIYALFLVAIRGDDTPCTECNFPLFKGSKTSAGLDIVEQSYVINGRALVAVQSSKVYEKGNNGVASLQVAGPSPALIQATYGNMQFAEPPASIPQSDKFINNPAFGVKVVAPLEISITTNKFIKDAIQEFTIMDMKGQVVSDGTLNSSSTRVKVPTKGSYIVKVGTDHKRVNVK